MPSNIILSENQSYSSSASNTPYNPWSFSLQPPLSITYIPGDAIPSNIDVTGTITDYPSIYGNAYTNYYVKVIQINPYIINSNNLQVVQLSGDVADAIGDGYELTDEASLNITNTFAFINLSVLPIGEHLTKVRFQVFGKTATDEFVLLDIVNYGVVVNVIGPEFIGLTPNQLNFSHVLAATLPATQEIQLQVTGTFNVTVFGLINLSGASLTLVANENGTKTYTGTGSQTITVGLDIDIDDEPIGSYTHTALFSNAYPTFLAVLNVDVYVFETAGLQINPIELIRDVCCGIGSRQVFLLAFLYH